MNCILHRNSTEGVTEVGRLVSHESAAGQRKDSAGAIVPAWLITEPSARHNDKIVLSSEFAPPARLEEPCLAFKFKGDKLAVNLEGQAGRHALLSRQLPAKSYKVAGWAPVFKEARNVGEPIWDVVATDLRGVKTVKPVSLNLPTLKDAANNPEMV